MKIKIITALIFSTSFAIGNSQNLDWTKQLGGVGIDEGFSTASDNNGNVYTSGRFTGTSDFDPGSGTFNMTTPSGSNAETFVSKLDASGNFVWAKQFTGTGVNDGRAIVVDGTGNSYITGTFSGTTDFDPGVGVTNLSATGGIDIFVVKLDPAGNLLWAKQFAGGSPSSDFGLSEKIALDVNNNTYTIGRFFGTMDFDPSAATFNLTSAGSFDVYITKLDASGNFVWAKRFGGTSGEFGMSIAVSNLGNIYATGKFSNTVDFDPNAGITNLTAIGSGDIYISKLDTNGNFIWAKQMGGASTSGQANGVAVDVNDNVYITGSFDGQIDFDPGVGTSNLTPLVAPDVFISKLDATGNFVWAKQIQSNGTTVGNAIAVDNNSNVYSTGIFDGTADFNPNTATFNLTAQGGRDAYISKLDINGDFVWGMQIAGDNFFDNGSAVFIGANKTIYATGYFSGTADFDPSPAISNLTSAGDKDVYILKLSQCSPSSSTDIQAACDSLTWIDGNTYFTSTNTPTFTLTNSTGCDSVVTLNLTIDVVDNSVTLNINTLTANQSGATYQWLDCNNSNAIITGATNQNYVVTSTGDYAVEVTFGSCVDTSACENVNITSINELNKSNVNIYPNPTNGIVTINLEEVTSATEYSIFSIDGKIITTGTTRTNTIVVDLINQNKGIYFIKLNSSTSSTINKLVKQ